MSYIVTHRALGALTDEQREALEVEPGALRALPPEQRLELALRAREVAQQKRNALWDGLTAFATAAIPIATFLGIERYFRLRSK